jgi:hypothetical protein
MIFLFDEKCSSNLITNVTLLKSKHKRNIFFLI